MLSIDSNIVIKTYAMIIAQPLKEESHSTTKKRL